MAAAMSGEIRVSEEEAEKCCGSCSEVSSGDDLRWEVDRRMVELELDAARALADFAHLALLERERSEVGRKWGSRGRRSKKRRGVRSEACGVDWGNKFNGFDELKSQDSIVDNNQRHKKVRKIVPTRMVKSEQDLDLPKAHELPRSTPQCSTSCVSSGGGRSKHQITEVEKEAKRLRRILANRESARQTIRRRQALCEELSRKAADLALEKECMKQEKELIMKEYQLLLDKNSNLKAQIARSLNAKELSSTSVKVVPTTSASLKQEPLLVCNSATVTPFIWSPIQSIKEQPLVHDPIVPTSKLETSDKQGNISSAHRSGPPIYIMPCPWFIPLGNGFYPHQLDSFSLINKQNDVSFNPCREGSSPKVTENLKSYQSSSSTKVVKDAKSSNNLSETTIRLSPGEENHLGSCTSGLNQTSPFHKSLGPTVIVKCENSFPQECTIREESGSSTNNHTADPFPEHLKEQHFYHTKKMVDAALATEARRRRKELTKLKNLNGRQLGLHC